MRNPRALLVEVAIGEIGVRETSRNQGPGIEKYWGATTYPEGCRDRQPWCAAVLCWVFLRTLALAVERGVEGGIALTERTRPKSAAVRYWPAWARRTGCLIFAPGSSKYVPEPGDVVIFTFSHIGLVEKRLNANSVRTLEGNTDDEGSREGKEFCRRVRSHSIIKAFIRVPCKGEVWR